MRFEMFPSESVSGATVYKTQSAELAEGGIATTIDLQTVQPLAYRERQASLKADALYDQLGSAIQGAKKRGPLDDPSAQDALGLPERRQKRHGRTLQRAGQDRIQAQR